MRSAGSRRPACRARPKTGSRTLSSRRGGRSPSASRRDTASTARGRTGARLFLFPGSQPFGDEMVARSEEDARNARGLQSVQERLVVGDDDGVVLGGKVHQRIVGGSSAFDDPVVLRKALRGPRLPVVFRQPVVLDEISVLDNPVHVSMAGLA